MLCISTVTIEKVHNINSIAFPG